MTNICVEQEKESVWKYVCFLPKLKEKTYVILQVMNPEFVPP